MTGPDTSEEFDAALTELIRNAVENGVDVEGGWDVRVEERADDWTVEITRVRPDG